MNLLIVFTAACSAISFTISTTSIFKGLRDLVSKIHPKVEELIHCPWCLNHYIALALILVTGKYLVTDQGYIIDVIVTTFAITGLSGLLHYVLLRAYEPVAREELKRKIFTQAKTSKTINAEKDTPASPVTPESKETLIKKLKELKTQLEKRKPPKDDPEPPSSDSKYGFL